MQAISESLEGFKCVRCPTDKQDRKDLMVQALCSIVSEPWNILLVCDIYFQIEVFQDYCTRKGKLHLTPKCRMIIELSPVRLVRERKYSLLEELWIHATR
jgi:hypothetical protein